MPSSNSLPDEVRRFVLTSIPSVPFLEAALLFQREPERSFTTGEVAAALYVQDLVAAELLEHLCQAGFVAQSGVQFTYAPRTEAMAVSLGQLAQAYFKDLVSVTKLIHDRTQKSASRFADAFKLRKDS